MNLKYEIIYSIWILLMIVQAWAIKLEYKINKKKSIPFGILAISYLFLGIGTFGAVFNISAMKFILILGLVLVILFHILYLIYLFRNIFNKKFINKEK